MNNRLVLLTIALVATSASAQMTMPMPAQSQANPQEREAPEIHTGTNKPAPDLLTEAQQRPALTLQQFEAWAIQNNPSITAAKATTQQLQAQAKQAGTWSNPTVGYSGEHIRGGSYNGGEQGMFAQQTIPLGNKLAARREVYKQQALAAGIDQQTQTTRVHADIQHAFYAALAAQEALTLRKAILDNANASVEAANQSANIGQADAPDILQSEVELEQAKIDYIEAQRTYIARFKTLAITSNQSDQPLARLIGNIETPPALNADAAVAKLLAESPELQRVQQEQLAAQAQIVSAKREVVPNLTIQAGEWHSGEQLNNLNQQAGWMSFAQVGIELPLWNRNQGGIAASQSAAIATQAGVARTRLQLTQRAQTLAQQYLTARFTAERYTAEILPRAQRAYDLYSMKYDSMAAPSQQVLHAKQTLLTLQMKRLEALAAEWTAAIALENNALEGSLSKPGDIQQ